MDLTPSTLQTCAVPIIPMGSPRFALPHHVLFQTLLKNKETIQSTLSVAKLEPTELWACLDSMAIHIINSILLPLCIIASQTRPWYTISPEKYWHIPVIPQRHESKALAHAQSDKFHLPEPSSCYFNWPKGRVRVVLGATKMMGPELTEMP